MRLLGEKNEVWWKLEVMKREYRISKSGGEVFMSECSIGKEKCNYGGW